MAESNRDEIAKLESMYAANPEGRVFTHLAEAYRKAGDLVRAREVLEDGLGRHSDSASGYVVLGRVMQDMGQAPEATGAFARVLELDPENRVALRALGELARAAGDTNQARAHFRQLLALDPSDDSVEALLAELEAGPAPKAAPAAEPATEPLSFEAAFQTAQATTSPETTPQAPAADVVAFDIASLASPPPDGGTPGELDIASLSAAPPTETPQDAPAPPAAELQPPPGDGDWSPAEGMAAALSGTGEAAQPLEGERSGGEGEAAEDTAPLPELEGTEPGWLAAGAEGGQSDSLGVPPVETPAEWETAQPTEVVTETMAELYRAQGHLDRALEVYRALLRDRPGDEQLERKLLELELAILSPETPAAEATAVATAEVAPEAGAETAAGEPAPEAATEAAPLAEALPAEAPRAEAPPEQGPETAVEPEAWAAPPEEEPWSAPAEAESPVAEATAHEELPEPWSEGALAAEPAADLAEFAPEATAEPVDFVPEPVTFGEEITAEPEAGALAESQAATSSPEPPVPAMEEVWTSGGQVPEDEPSPYDFQAPEEEVGPPVSGYLRALVAWRRAAPVAGVPDAARAVEQPGAYDTPAGFEPAFYEPPAPETAGFEAPAGYEQSGHADQGFMAPPVEPPAGFEADEPEPWAASETRYTEEAVAESTPETLPEEWLDTAAAAPESTEAAPWTPPPTEPTWADDAADAPVVPQAEEPAPAADLDWLTGPNGVAPETPPPALPSAGGEPAQGAGPTDDDDLEMFRAWLQSLKK